MRHSAWTFSYVRRNALDSYTICTRPKCGAMVRAKVVEIVDAPGRDEINESLSDGYCSRACAKLDGPRLGLEVQ